MEDVDGAEQSDADASSFHSSDEESDNDGNAEDEENPAEDVAATKENPAGDVPPTKENPADDEAPTKENPADPDDVPRGDMMAEDMLRKVCFYTNACLQT